MTRKASNGDGGIYPRQLKNGTTVWDVRWSYRINGKPDRGVKKGFRTRSDAARFKRQVTAEVDAQRFIKPAKVLLGDYLEGWLGGLRHKPQTVTGYRRKVRLHVLPRIGHIPLEKLTPLHLDALYGELLRTGSPGGLGPLSPSTVREVHHILSGALRVAVRSDLLIASPTGRANPPSPSQVRAARPEFRTWAAEQVRAFLNASKGDQYYALWHLLATTGMRRGEALGLRWRDLDLGHARLTIRQSVGEERLEQKQPDGTVRRVRRLVIGSTKTDKPRVIGLDAETVAVLRQHRARQSEERLRLGDRWQDNDLIFCRGELWLSKDAQAGGLLDPDRVSEAFVRDVTRSGVPRIRLHDVRHTWATLALQAGVHPKVVQERLGHKTVSITLDIYSHVTPGMDADAASQVAALFA